MKPEILQYLSLKERRHFMKCPDCGNYFDMRDLEDVFNHFHKSNQVLVYSRSVKVGEPDDTYMLPYKRGNSQVRHLLLLGFGEVFSCIVRLTDCFFCSTPMDLTEFIVSARSLLPAYSVDLLLLFVWFMIEIA